MSLGCDVCRNFDTAGVQTEKQFSRTLDQLVTSLKGGCTSCSFVSELLSIVDSEWQAWLSSPPLKRAIHSQAVAEWAVGRGAWDYRHGDKGSTKGESVEQVSWDIYSSRCVKCYVCISIHYELFTITWEWVIPLLTYEGQSSPWRDLGAGRGISCNTSSKEAFETPRQVDQRLYSLSWRLQSKSSLHAFANQSFGCWTRTR